MYLDSYDLYFPFQLRMLDFKLPFLLLVLALANVVIVTGNPLPWWLPGKDASVSHSSFLLY